MEGFKDLIRFWWMGYVANGSTCHCLEVKLKALKKDLKVGNKEVFENVSFNKVEALSHIRFWDSKDSLSSLK